MNFSFCNEILSLSLFEVINCFLFPPFLFLRLTESQRRLIAPSIPLKLCAENYAEAALFRDVVPTTYLNSFFVQNILCCLRFFVV